MSSPKKIRRWNRFEIAFNQEDWANKALCKADWRQTPDKMQGLREMGKDAAEEATQDPLPPSEVAVAAPAPERALQSESALSESKEERESASPPQKSTLGRLETPSLWAEARSQASQSAPKTKNRR
jgi:hypothetical protein